MFGLCPRLGGMGKRTWYGRLAKLAGFELAATAVSSPATWASTSSLEMHTLAELFGIADGITVTRDRAMRIPTIAKGRRVVAGTIGRMSLVTTKRSRRTPFDMPLLIQPERDRPLSATLTWTVDALMFYPRTWWIVQERDAAGWPRWVKWLDWADAELDRDGRLVKAWGNPVLARDVITFEGIDGGLLHDGRETIQRVIAINKAAALAEANPVPSVDLHWDGEDIEDTKIDSLIQRWVEARKSHGVGYSSKGLKVNALGIQPEQLLIDGRRALLAELVRQIGMPAWAADVAIEGMSQTYQNRASRNWELIDLACAPIMSAIAGRLSMPDVTPQGWVTTFATDELTRDDMKTRFETYRIGLGSKTGDLAFITQEQIADWEGWAAA